MSALLQEAACCSLSDTGTLTAINKMVGAPHRTRHAAASPRPYVHVPIQIDVNSAAFKWSTSIREGQAEHKTNKPARSNKGRRSYLHHQSEELHNHPNGPGRMVTMALS
eukprot:2134275-Amphidinium_carterae.1